MRIVLDTNILPELSGQRVHLVRVAGELKLPPRYRSAGGAQATACRPGRDLRPHR